MNRQSDRLPQGWKWVRLGDVCEVILGQSPPSSTYRKIPEGLPFFQGKADFGDISPNPTTWCVEPKKVAEAGDVLISMRAPVGPTNIANTRCCIGRGLAAIRCRNEADRDFVLAGLKLYESDISSMGTGSLFNAITGKQLKEFVFPLPPLPEQKRIAALLNQQMAYVEKARKAAEEMLEAAQALPGAFLRQVFPAHGDALPAGWKWAALGEIILGKPQYGSVARKVPYNGKVRYVRITDLTDRGELKPDDPVSPSVVQPDRFLEPGDLLIARSGSVGRTYLHGNLPGTYQYAGYLIRFRIDPAKSLPGYVFYVSKSDLWREWIVSNSKTSTLTNINAKQYSSFRLPLPPLCEQKRIAALLKEQMAYVETVRMSAREQLDAINALPAALLRRAFAGTL